VDQDEALKKARQFAQIAYSAEMNNVAREFNAKLVEVRHQMAARGILMSGGMVRETARLSGERVTSLLTKRLELLLEGYELYGVEITDGIAEETLDDVMKLRETLIATSASTGASIGTVSLPGGSGQPYTQLLGEFVPVSAGSVKTEIDRRRLMRKKSEAVQVNVYHVYGHQPRWNMNSTDHSVNVVSASSEQIFANLRQQIAEQVPAGEEQNDILDRLSQLEQAQGSRSFGQKYSDFIASAANHMSLIAPFIPALTEILSKTVT